MLLWSLTLLLTLLSSSSDVIAHQQGNAAVDPPAPLPVPAKAPPHPPPPDQPDQNKYFHEPGNHKAGEDDRLGHHDSRYFHGLVSDEERTESLRHMTRAYLHRFQSLGLETWIAHGTLLGWWWNGKILPWDWDIDTQVLDATLLYMADHHNRTTYDYVSEDGKFRRKYLLDVNPWARIRSRGDGANIIDARWIDTVNGLYIDITGLSELDPDQKPGIWSCKNFHDYHVRKLYPLRESIFEGMPALIPYAYDQILAEEYHPQALTSMSHHEHRWHEDTRQWIANSPKGT